MPTITTYEQVGIKRDISEQISNIAPAKTPFQTMIGSRKVKNTFFEWMEDNLDPPASNAQVEGADAPTSTYSTIRNRQNRTQIFTKTAKISGTGEAVELLGRDKDLAYQLARKSTELKRDLEFAYIGLNQTAVEGDNVSVARKMDGAQALIDPTLKFHAADASVGLTGLGLAAFNETALTKANQALYGVGGEATVLMVKPADSLLIADFAKATGRLRELEAGEKKITNVVNFYESPFGTQKVVLNRWLYTHHSYLLDPEMWQKATLRPWFRQTLAKTGDSTNVQILGEFSLVHRNWLASAIIGDLS